MIRLARDGDREAILAVIDPAPTKELYFVSRNDGTHQFSETLAEHNRNVQKYQVQFFKKKPEVRSKK